MQRRDYILNIETLKERAQVIAREHGSVVRGVSRSSITGDIKRCSTKLVQCYKAIDEDMKSRFGMVPAAEWLVENFYIIEEHMKDIQYNLYSGYFKDLPVLSEEPLKGILRSLAIARELVYFTNGRFDEEIIYTFLDEYQKTTPLTMAELWSIPLMVKIVLIHIIEDMAMDIVSTQKLKRKAYSWGNKLLDAYEKSPAQLARVLEQHDSLFDYIPSAYAEALLRLLQDYGPEAAPIIKHIDKQLLDQGSSADIIIEQEYKRQTEAKVAMGNAITSLKFITEMKWETIFEELSMVDKILQKDPAGIYSQMDFESRDYYRREVAKLAKRGDVGELDVADMVLKCIEEGDGQLQGDIRYSHVGYYIVGKGRTVLEERIGLRTKRESRRANIYMGGIVCTAAILIGLFLYLAGVLTESFPLVAILYIALALIPIATLVIGICNWLITYIYPPSILPRLELKDGIPEQFRTMVIIPTLLTSEERVDELVEQMEVFYLANREERLHFALVGDFKDGENEHEPSDASIVEAGIRAVKELNEKYGESIFFYFHRYRQWNDSQGQWMGWERKRGALVEFNRLLRGDEDTSYYIKEGDLSILPNIKYVITLDADTQLPREMAKKLIGIMGHPLNRPVLNEAATLVVDGYGIVQPRIGVSVESATSSFFALKFSGQVGIDPYTTAVSDVYQDLFKEGIFTGKGIYDVDIFTKVLDGAIPENAVLSHDLLEGCYIRAGLATDLEFIDGYPSHYIAYAMRQHRWTRGDWQLLPWLGKKNPLSSISKWKIADNMRRSLISPVLLLILILSSLNILVGSKWWIGLSLATIIYPFILDMVGCLIGYYRRWRRHIRVTEVFAEVGSTIWQTFLALVFVAYQGYLMADAILRTIVRVFFTHKNMLEWVTAADTERKFTGSFGDFRVKMLPGIVIGVFEILATLSIPSSYTALGLGLGVIWICSPWIAYLISRPRKTVEHNLSDSDMQTLRLIARKTWKYFEDFVTEDDNWLPPDNYQAEPPTGVAHRTSPTNIGLLLMSNLVAKDLGYIGVLEFVERTEKTINTLMNMEKWQGHIYNWYDTKTLEPLKPSYVSTVDSGNLASYLIVLLEGLDELETNPIIDRQVLEGIRDTISVYGNMDTDKMLDLFPKHIMARDFTLTRWYRILMSIDEGEQSELKEPLNAYINEIDKLLPWVKILTDIPDFLLETAGSYRDINRRLLELLSLLNHPLAMQDYISSYQEILDTLSDIGLAMENDTHRDTSYHIALKWFEELQYALEMSFENLKRLLVRIDSLKEDIETLFDDMDFGSLYDSSKELFSIGYDIENETLTNSYYDLLASEARQASFIAIAKGDIPKRHWFKMGRALTMIENNKVLLSWSGTMFEYLMPLLIMKNYEYTLFSQTYRGVVKGQIRYGQRRHTPWGVSESGYNAFDRDLNYQYRAFGVPTLGLKRGLGEDIVIAPYATVLALQVKPSLAMQNIRRLIDEGLDGEYGLFEAVDYTPSRLPRGKKSAIIESFMAHHQGMSLVSIDNIIHENVMQRRFHAQPIVKSTHLLLQERIPVREVYLKDFVEPVAPIYRTRKSHSHRARRLSSANTQIPEVQILSNGNFSTMITNSGGGYIKYRDIAISRWRQDTVRDDWGLCLYVQNLNSNNFWSATHMPCGGRTERYSVEFETDRVTYMRRNGNLDTRTDIVVSPTQDIEIRRLTIKNRSMYRRVVDVTSYFELVIAPLISDIAHRAFSNLFIVTEFLPEYNTLIAHRRSGANISSDTWVIHTVVLEQGEDIGAVQYETNRLKFIGRGRDVSSPAAMDPGTPLSNVTGPVIDPIMSLRKRIGIGGGEVAKISFITGAASSREEAIELAREYGSSKPIESTFELAWTRSQVELRYLDISFGDANLYQSMASHVLYKSPNKMLQRDTIMKNSKGRSGLWAYGISGELPIVLIKVGAMEDMDLVKQMLSAHEYWRTKGLNVDLVILNEYGNSYEQPIQERIMDLISISHGRDLIDCPGGIFLRQTSHMALEDVRAIIAASCLVIRGDGGSIEGQLRGRRPYILPKSIKKIPSPQYNYVDPPKFSKDELTFYNGLGGFWQNGKEYVIQLTADEHTPMPWSNVIANETFGTLVTELGSGYTWHKNSRENKITAWSNDPIVDPPSEAIYLRDDQTGAAWTITPSPIRGQEEYVIRHGQGYSIFEHNSHGLYCTQTIYVPRRDSVKVNLITLYNPTPHPREISIYYYAEWILGVDRSDGSQFIKSRYDQDLDVFLAENPFNEEFSGQQAFLFSSGTITSYTADRKEFIGRNGSLKWPAALERESLADTAGAGFDQCGAIHVKLTIPGDSKENIALILGQSDSMSEISDLAQKYRRLKNIEMELAEVKDFWDKTLDTIRVNTPDQSFNMLLNRWLLYQSLGCRLWARAAFYQAGGAFGFRDQLQDTLAIVYSHPELVRRQILLHAQHQFIEGDVQHWWHPPNRGVRTRITDDLLFLPFITADYIRVTGDESILDEQLTYLEDRELTVDEKDRYNSPAISQKRESLYDHCIRAIERAARFGNHGLPLIGGGDWNDGMDRVGEKGLGESVWLGWFMYRVLNDFIPICEMRKDFERSRTLGAIADKLLTSIEEHGWDGGWYRRAYFDDGTPLGSEYNDECQIDSISQSWATISGGGRKERINEAMRSLENYLVDREIGIIKLLTPPFYGTKLDPGYIKGYVPGVRENGGQYTHAATWVILAYAMLGDGNRAMELYNMINPINHSRTWTEVSKYKVEPYVMAADVYSVSPYEGRGGWTWYTGAAAWMYRVAVEWILGFKKEGNKLRIEPCIPDEWREFTIHYRYGNTLYSIRVRNTREKYIDEPTTIELIDDGAHHHVEIKI